nr:RNA-directed DNA polymerase, eukaryota [Tanacetum cinerariifolium]
MVVASVCRAALEGYVWVLLDGGPACAFSDSDITMMEEDLNILKLAVKEARSLKGTSINVVDLIRLKLGNRDSFLFWNDKWYAGGVIKELFPRLYALELHKHATVRMKLMAPSLDNSFRRRVRSGAEESQFNSLLEIVQVINLVPCEDMYFWSLESEGDYSVASIRRLINEKRFQEVGIFTRWVKSVPSKVNITAWKIKTNALPTRFNLSRRGMDIDTLMCPVCKGGAETTSHLFFQCILSKQIMRKVSSWWNVDYTDVNSYEEWRVWLVSIRIPNKLKSMMEGVFYGLWRSIWNFRNKLLFDNKTPKKALIFDNLVSLSFNWSQSSQTSGWATSSKASDENIYSRLLNDLKAHTKKARTDPTMSSEYERYVNSDFVTHLRPKEFATFDVLGLWKEKETMFSVLSRMAMDIISVQASSVASESSFSTSERVLSIQRTKLTPASLEMCMCLKDHLDAKERKQDKCPLEIPLDFEEDVFDDEVQRNEAIPLSDEKIALDASSEGTMSPGGPLYDYMMSSEAEDDR